MVQFSNPEGNKEEAEKENREFNGASSKRKLENHGEGGEISKKKKKSKANGHGHRRHSVSTKPARDPRDEAVTDTPEETPIEVSRSPSPVIDFDGLSRPSMSSSFDLCHVSSNGGNIGFLSLTNLTSFQAKVHENVLMNPQNKQLSE